MKISVKLPMGANQILIEGEVSDFKDMIKKLSTFEGIPTECKHCKSKNLWPSYRQPEGFTYYSIKCSDCGWEFKYGQKKEGGGLFPKGWEAPHKGKDELKQGQISADEFPPVSDDEISF